MGPRANRRTLLSGIACALPVLLSGCSATDDSPTSSPTPTPHATESPSETGTPTTPTEKPTGTRTETPTDTPSPEPTPTPRPERRLEFGDWYTADRLDHTVVSMELVTRFEWEPDGRTYEMPGDRQLLVATTRIRNDDAEANRSHARFLALVSGNVHREQPDFDHPELGNVGTDELTRVEHDQQFLDHGMLLRAGETRTAWTVYVVPRTASREDVEIAFEYRYARAHDFPIRWIPEGDG